MLTCSTLGVFALLSGVILAESLGSILGLDGFFIGNCAAFMVCVDQTMGACPPDWVVPGQLVWFWLVLVWLVWCTSEG